MQSSLFKATHSKLTHSAQAMNTLNLLLRPAQFKISSKVNQHYIPNKAVLPKFEARDNKA